MAMKRSPAEWRVQRKNLAQTSGGWDSAWLVFGASIRPAELSKQRQGLLQVRAG